MSRRCNRDVFGVREWPGRTASGVKSLPRNGLLQMAVLLPCGSIADIQIGFIGPFDRPRFIVGDEFSRNIYSSVWILLIFGQVIWGLVLSANECLAKHLIRIRRWSSATWTVPRLSVSLGACFMDKSMYFDWD